MRFSAMTLPRPARLGLLCGTALLLAGCDKPLDFDLRGNFGNAPSTSEAALNAAKTADRPRPDNRGVISYPNYQVVVAQRGDTVGDVARRVGLSPDAVARFNGLTAGDPLRPGEVVALPSRVAEPSAATGAAATGPIQPAPVDITAMAGGAIDRAQAAPVQSSALPTAQTGAEPVRHQVRRGETAYSIARSYNVSVRSLADWNGLGSSFDVREGQYLLIPVAETPRPTTNTGAIAAPMTATTALSPATTAPGTGSPTPTPPSATQPLPKDTKPAAAPAPKPDSTPDLGRTQTTAASGGKLAMPVQGAIIREFTKGKTDGIDIQAAPGTPIKAAANGTVAAITSDADQVPIIVVKHPDNLLTVYANVDGISVKKGDTVTRGQPLAKLRGGSDNYVHFEVRKGFDSVDPMPYLR